MTTMHASPVPPAPMAEPAIPASALDYATPVPRDRTAGAGNKLLVLTTSLAVAILGANAFADAAGLPPVRDWNRQADVAFVRVLCGFVVFLLSLAAVPVLIRAFHAVVGVLARTPVRPAQPVALAMICCGTVCVLAALVTELLALQTADQMLLEMARQGMGFQARTPLAIHLASFAALVAGAALVGIGVWSSLGTRRPGR